MSTEDDILEFLLNDESRISTAQGNPVEFERRQFEAQLEIHLSEVYYRLAAKPISMQIIVDEDDGELQITAVFSIKGKTWKLSRPDGDENRWIIQGPDRKQAFYMCSNATLRKRLLHWIRISLGKT